MNRLPNKEFRQMIPLLKEKNFYEHEEPRPIAWPEYNRAQIQEATEILNFIREAVDVAGLWIRKRKVGKPLTNPKSLAKAILACEFLSLPERQAQGWMTILGPFLGIHERLDDRVIGDAYDKPEVLHILKQVFEMSKTSDGKLCGDGTGLETSRKQNYESTKRTCGYMTSIVDSREVVQAFDVNDFDEKRAMRKLITQVKGKSLCLDANFVDRALIRAIADLGMIPYVFPKKNIKLNGSQAWKQMYLELFYSVMQWLTEYHLRSHSESFHSSFKRRNKPVMRRRPFCQLVQITARIIIHNRRRLSYFNRLSA